VAYHLKRTLFNTSTFFPIHCSKSSSPCNLCSSESAIKPWNLCHAL